MAGEAGGAVALNGGGFVVDDQRVVVAQVVTQLQIQGSGETIVCAVGAQLKRERGGFDLAG